MIRLSPSGIREYLDRIPTADLYFLNPLAELTRQDLPIPPPRLLAPNVYLAGRTGVIVRYGRAEDIGRLKLAGAGRIVYIVDDDFTAGASDHGLPERYRAKLRAFFEGDWATLKDAADIVVVPGAELAEIYGAKARVIPPAWDLPPASSRHFDDAKRIEIVHLGTGSHSGDLASIAPVLAKLLDEYPRARLTLFAGNTAPGALRSHRRVRLRRPLSWWRYKRALPRMRFHLALYPLAATAFNNARSANKLFEHAIVGAASLMSANPALRAASGGELPALFVEGGADEWAARIEAFLNRPDAMREHADATAAHILASDPLGHAARQWAELLAPQL
jgi:hypothetical protein